MLRSSGKHGPVLVQSGKGNTGVPQNKLQIFSKSFLVAVTNPKGYLFFTAFLPQFLILSKPLFSQYVTLAMIFITVDVAVMLAYAGLGAKAMQFLSDQGAKWIDRTCGSFLIALGVVLAFVRRSEV